MIPGSVTATSDNALETRNLALTSTFVVQGSCTGVVFAIGDRTVMGRIVAMSGETEFKLTTVQREVWFFTKIISSLALTMFIVAIIVWAAWLRVDFPGYETASGAIINSIGCLTAFVPQAYSASLVEDGRPLRASDLLSQPGGRSSALLDLAAVARPQRVEHAVLVDPLVGVRAE